jgi:hypothetical protein
MGDASSGRYFGATSKTSPLWPVKRNDIDLVIQKARSFETGEYKKICGTKQS